MTKKFFALLSIVALVAPFSGNAAAVSLADRLKGYVLLQVESHGEAYYVGSDDGVRYYLRDGDAAYGLMRGKGLGISEADYAKLAAGNADLRARVRGRIVLRVHAHGEAYYLCPRTGTFSYIKDGEAAYAIMRECGLGITNADLAQITISETLNTKNEIPKIPAAEAEIPATNDQQPNTSNQIAGCSIFPADNPWNQDVSTLPVHANSTAYVNSIGLAADLHPDFGENVQYGIPYNIVDSATPKYAVAFTYDDESDAGPYPIPARPEIEAGSDQHYIALDKDGCKLYELYDTQLNTDRGMGWTAGSGAIWDLNSNALRPAGWTSADAAGLPILPGLVRYDEVAAGAVNHAIRFTAPRTQAAYISPARHQAGFGTDAALPPMGLRVRLKANYDISDLPAQAKVIATAMKKYGMILADNGSPWYFQGAYSSGWRDDDLNTLKSIPGSAFEAVQTGDIVK